MSKFLYGTRVAFIGENNDLKEGVIKEAFDDMQVATVLMDNGDLVKTRFTDLAILPEKVIQDEKPAEEITETTETTETTAPIEKSEITITPDEFREKSVKVLSKLSKEIGDPMLPMVGVAIISEVHKALFLESPENV